MLYITLLKCAEHNMFTVCSTQHVYSVQYTTFLQCTVHNMFTLCSTQHVYSVQYTTCLQCAVHNMFTVYIFPWPDSFLVSGKVNQSGMIIGKNRTYVILSLHVSGQDRSRGWFSSSSSTPPCNLRCMREGWILTGSFSCIREAQPQGEHDREQDKVRNRLG